MLSGASEGQRMGVYDQAGRFAVSAEPAFVLKRLGPVTGLTLVFRRWLPTRGLPLPGGPDRDADRVADDANAPERPWLLIFENQAQHDPDKPKVLQLEALVFLNHAKDTDRGGGELRPLPVFVYLRGECPRAGVEVRTPTGCGFVGTPAVWEVARDDAAECLAKLARGEVSWGALFWVPLMAGGGAAAAEWRGLLDQRVPEKQRAEVAYVALLFAELAGCRADFERLLQGVIITESAVYNEVFDLGQMRLARKDLTRVIRLRFPELLTPDVERAIADQPNLVLMMEWLDAAFTVPTAADLMTVLSR